MRVADVVAGTLANFGARQAYGMPGGEVVTLVNAFNNAGIHFTLARHETAAAIMAAGHATMTGNIGVLVTTLGPGLVNAVNGIADASQEHTPLIVFAGVVDHHLRHRYTHQILDQRMLLRPLVKGCFEIEPDGAGAVVARALELALTHPMGPVLIEIAPQTAASMAGPNTKMPTPVRRLRVTSLPDERQHIKDTLATAERPLIVAGYDAARSGAADALRSLAETFGIPVITTYKAKGVIPESHEMALGAAGLSPLADEILLPLCRAADLVLLIGYDPIEMRPGWLDPFQASATVIEISAGPYDHAMHTAAMRLESDIKAAVSALADAVRTNGKSWSCKSPAKAKAALDARFETPATWGAHAAIDVLQTALPADTTVTVDSGAHRILLSQKLKFERPLALLQSAGFCTMGAAIPLAAGAKTARRNDPVVAVVGDGGFEMGLGELATLRDENLPVVIVVFQDGSLALIELKQRQASLPLAGVRLGPTRYEDVSRAFGGDGYRVASAADFESALSKALAAPVFSVIVCEIEASDYAGRI